MITKFDFQAPDMGRVSGDSKHVSKEVSFESGDLELPSGYVKIAIENDKMTIEIVDFPINSMVIFNSYVKLPEGILLKLISMDWFKGFFFTGNPHDLHGKIGLVSG